MLWDQYSIMGKECGDINPDLEKIIKNWDVTEERLDNYKMIIFLFFTFIE